MPHLELVKPEEMPQVIRIASELYEANHSLKDTQKQATVQAASEVGLTEAHLELAAEKWLQQRQAQELATIRKQERRQRMLLVGAILLFPAMMLLLRLIPALLALFFVK